MESFRRGPVNEFGQDSEKGNSCGFFFVLFCFFKNKTKPGRKKKKKEPFLPQEQVLNC